MRKNGVICIIAVAIIAGGFYLYGEIFKDNRFAVNKNVNSPTPKSDLYLPGLDQLIKFYQRKHPKILLPSQVKIVSIVESLPDEASGGWPWHGAAIPRNEH